MKKLFIIISYLLVAVLASFGTMSYLAAHGYLRTEVSKLEELEGLIDRVFIEEPDFGKLEDAAADAMVTATGDRWSFYIPADSYQAYQDNAANAYVGVGITISPNEDPLGFLVKEVTPGGPADEAGMLVDDVLIAVNGVDVTGTDSDGTKVLVQGEAGTSVSITVLRNGERITLDMVRREVLVPVTTWSLLDSGYGLIRIRNFSSRCASESIEAIETLMAQDVKGIVFDLRFNPGGYKKELVELLDYILPEGDLFKSELYTGVSSTDTSDASHIEIPIAVLVNQDTYSAAEFFAAALREYDYAIIGGSQTVGKGYFQSTFDLSDGSAVALSIGKYYTPKGVSLAGVGITPDYPVEVDEMTEAAIYYNRLAPEEDLQLQAVLRALEK